ncbi:MAG: TVP38/TMEM64 family protein [Verrucomicrobia bacterium]|nr:TVP38/TMEM64 family protein [Verrucomicrobiota bacterium]
MARKLLSILPFALILLGILIFYVSGAYHLFSFEAIQQEHLKWKSFVHEKPVVSALYFIGVYVLSVVLVIPDSTVLTVLGGFLFPMPLAIAYTCISETIGGTIFFLAARMAYLETMGRKKKGVLNEMQRKFHEDQACYLLFLRFSHLLPFWVINLGAGVFHVRPMTFIWTTLVGVFPLTFFLVEGGESLSKYFETHTYFQLRGVFTPALKVTLIALGCIALLPILYKKFKRSSQR